MPNNLGFMLFSMVLRACSGGCASETRFEYLCRYMKDLPLGTPASQVAAALGVDEPRERLHPVPGEYTYSRLGFWLSRSEYVYICVISDPSDGSDGLERLDRCWYIGYYWVAVDNMCRAHVVYDDPEKTIRDSCGVIDRP